MDSPTEDQLVHAGNLTARIQGSELRDVRAGDVVLASRVYVAVRDHNWDTIPGAIDDYRLDAAGDGFRVSFTVRHEQGAVDFRWTGEILGTPAGEITFTMHGIAGSSFRYNKIGLNIHHPLRDSIGRRYVARTPAGSVDGILPELIEPQFYENGFPTGMFEAFDELTLDYASGARAQFSFQGDLFEMQDHRNWTDGNLKTYGTPCQLGFPMDARSGQLLKQEVTMSLTGPPATTYAAENSTTITVDSGTIPIPRFGLGVPSHSTETVAHELDLLRLLHLDHLRVDLDLGDGRWVAALHDGALHATRLDAAIELALTIHDEESTDFGRLDREIGNLTARIARVLVFSAHDKSTPSSLLSTVRTALHGVVDAAFVGGTNAYFAEINRDRPDPKAMDGIVFSITPQVHAFDDASLVETLPAQADVVESARAMADGVPIFVSPVTLRPRFNPNATAVSEDSDTDSLPDQVDPRQRLLFGAVWTLGSFANLAAAGAAGVTYYETTGWRGVMESSAGTQGPNLFGSSPGEVFPVFHLLADIREGSPGELRRCHIGDPAKAQAIALETTDGVRLLVGNVTRSEIEVRLVGVPDGERTLRRLDERSAGLAASDPIGYRSSATGEPAPGNESTIRLSPYELVRLDIATR